MSAMIRSEARQRMVRRGGLVAGVLVLLALLFLVTGHWILGIVFGAAAAAAVGLFMQLRTVR
jgi:uncharacterized membrane protein YccC